MYDDLIQKYRADRRRLSVDPRSTEPTLESYDELEEVENMMTDRTTKLEKLINKLKADEEVHPKETLRAYLWMEYTSIYIVLLDLSLDPSEQVAQPARTVVDYIHSRLMDSILGRRCLEFDELVSPEEDTQNISTKGQHSLDAPTSTSFGKFRNHSHSNLISSSLTSMHSNPSHVNGKLTTDGANNVSNRSSTSVFHSFSTVNNLVPNFVKSSGWRTPFNNLSRSPEQAVFPSTDREVPVESSSSQQTDAINGLRKSASFSPIVRLDRHHDELQPLTTSPLKHPNFSHGLSSASSETQFGKDGDERLRKLVNDQSIEAIIAHTRASDHIRRQTDRTYPLQPSFPTTCASTTSPIPPQALKHQAIPPIIESDPTEETDCLYYLGLQDLERLGKELKRELGINGHDGPSSPKSCAEREGSKKRMLPLSSNYYELSSHIFLKPKMTNSVGESESDSDSANNVDPENEEDESNPQNQSDHSHHHVLQSSKTSGNHPPTGLGLGLVGDQHVPLPHPLSQSNLQSLYPHLLHPQHLELQDGGSLDNIKDSWRKQRNLKVILDSPILKPEPISNDWENLLVSFREPTAQRSIVNSLLMHQFENQLISSDLSGFLTIYDWKSKTRLNRFRVSDHRPSVISSLQLLNQDTVSLLLASTPDGNVRIFRDYDRPDRVEVVTAFKALPNNEPSSFGESGVVTDWQQSTGLLIVGGNSREIKVWNSRRESCIENLKTRSNSPLTTISSDHHSGWIISAGFGDGSIRIYDRRKATKNSMVKVYRSFHSSWLTKLKFQDGNRRELVSGDSTGSISQWDFRLDFPLRSFHSHPEGMPVLDLHDHAPILASGSMNGNVKLWDLTHDCDRDQVERVPEVLINFKNLVHDRSPLPNPRSSSWTTKTGSMNPVWSSPATQLVDADPDIGHPITGLCFHPYRMMISIGDASGSLNVYSSDKKSSLS